MAAGVGAVGVGIGGSFNTKNDSAAKISFALAYSSLLPALNTGINTVVLKRPSSEMYGGGEDITNTSPTVIEFTYVPGG